MIPQNCATSDLQVYTPTADKPWDKRRIEHLYRRMAFGATPAQIDAALAMNPADLVDQIIDEAIIMPTAPMPVWADWTRDPLYGYTSNDDFNSESRDHRNEWYRQWFTDMLNNGFREQMSLFWHNHFVTEWGRYRCSMYLYQYHKLLQQYAVGNFRNFVYDMGITPAMLIYLDSAVSTKNSPNENYARELYELFTLGESNGYTHDDIIETSKALTGWRASTQDCTPAYFDASRFDFGPKTIFGQTGNWNYDDVHDILFQERATQAAQHICGKIYRYFVYNESNTEIINELAQTFLNNNFEIAPVLRQLFKSEHFFDNAIIGAKIKSPVELFISILHQTGMSYDDGTLTDIYNRSAALGQRIFEPIDVAGWPGHRTWITEDALTNRWDLVFRTFFNNVSDSNKQVLVDLAKVLSDESNDPAFITQSIVDYIFPNGMGTQETYDTATTVFKADIPEYYFIEGLWNLNWPEAQDQMVLLFRYLIRLPEFQLA